MDVNSHRLFSLYFLTKNDVNNTNTIKPTKPPSPSEVIRAERFATTSIPNTVPPVRTVQRIDTGKTAINTDDNPPKNPVTYLITESIFFSFLKFMITPNSCVFVMINTTKSRQNN